VVLTEDAVSLEPVDRMEFQLRPATLVAQRDDLVDKRAALASVVGVGGNILESAAAQAAQDCTLIGCSRKCQAPWESEAPVGSPGPSVDAAVDAVAVRAPVAADGHG